MALAHRGKPNLALWLGLLSLMLLFVGLRWRTYDRPLIRDEGEYAYSAELLKRGVPPYEYSYLQKPPMIVYTYAVASLLGPETFWTPRIMAYLFTA